MCEPSQPSLSSTASRDLSRPRLTLPECRSQPTAPTFIRAKIASVRYIVRNFDGIIVASAGPFTLYPSRTFTYSTQDTQLFAEDSVVVPTIELDQGSLQILASGPQVHCSAQLVDAAGRSAYNVTPLPAIRSNQEAGTEE